MIEKPEETDRFGNLCTYVQSADDKAGFPVQSELGIITSIFILAVKVTTDFIERLIIRVLNSDHMFGLSTLILENIGILFLDSIAVIITILLKLYSFISNFTHVSKFIFFIITVMILHASGQYIVSLFNTNISNQLNLDGLYSTSICIYNWPETKQELVRIKLRS